MSWEGDENTNSIVAALCLASSRGADVCLFPELSVTGIHRKIAALAKPDLVSTWLETVSNACARYGIAASVGAPTFGDNGPIRISQLFLDQHGSVAGTVHKSGLTAPEATFFAPGNSRPTIGLLGRKWSAIICREIDDADVLARHFAVDAPEIVVWPGSMKPDPDKPRTDPPEHVHRAQDFARRCGTYVIMANWPNALNRPEESAECGNSVVISPDGEILLTLPRAEAGLAVFNLGEAVYEWHVQDAGPATQSGERPLAKT